jgi:hypothetical protein
MGSRKSFLEVSAAESYSFAMPKNQGASSALVHRIWYT